MKLEQLYEDNFLNLDPSQQLQFIRDYRTKRNEDIVLPQEQKPKSKTLSNIDPDTKKLLATLGISMSALKALQNINTEEEDDGDDEGLFDS